jgi:DNA-binding CsgD family transcriptional regulator
VNNNDEWEEFRIWYEETSGAFLSTLNEKYPDLSPLEIKLAALIRLLLSTKDIAGLLGREIATVEKGRYRLRKKLKLEPNENLTKFLLSI